MLSLSIRDVALVIWFLTGEQRLLGSIACGPEQNFFYLALFLLRSAHGEIARGTFNMCNPSWLSHDVDEEHLFSCRKSKKEVPFSLFSSKSLKCGPNLTAFREILSRDVSLRNRKGYFHDRTAF